MLRYIAKRLLFMIPLLFGITIICFTVMHLAPGSPTDLQTQMNPRASVEMKERLRAMYDLDKPLHEQYFRWVGKLAVLDLGISFSTDRRPVADKILERLPITILLNVLSMLLILVVAIPLGVLSAVRQDSLFDRITGVFVFIGFAVPTFWLALLLMILFGVHLGWLPISGIRSLNYEYLPPGMAFWDLIRHLILPVLLVRLRRAGRSLPVHAGEHAGGDPPGLHHDGPGQGAFRAGRDLPARPAKRPPAGDHHPRPVRSRADRGERDLRDDLRHSRDGAALLHGGHGAGTIRWSWGSSSSARCSRCSGI